MEKFLNTYSFLIIAFIVATAVFLIAQSRLGLKPGLIATGGTVLALLVFQIISTNPNQGLESTPYPTMTNGLESASLVHVYSNY